MNSLVSVLSTLVSVFLFALLLAALNKRRQIEEENKVLWGQVNHYENYLKVRAGEDEERQRMAIRN